MSRDMNLIRDILVFIEKSSDCISAEDVYNEFKVKSAYSQELITHHLDLLAQAKLVRGVVVHEVPGGRPVIQSGGSLELTWEGYEFADSAKNDGLWKQAKTVITKKGGALTFEIAKAVLISLLKSRLELD